MAPRRAVSTKKDEIEVRQLESWDEIDAMLLQRHKTIVGMSGAGKSFTARGILHRDIRQGRRSAILCPTGVWWGAAYTPKGKRNKYPIVIVGGEHADIPLDAAPPDVLGKFFAGQTGSHMIFDISDLMSGGAKERWVTDFAQAIFHANKKSMSLVIDEADGFCPQSPMPDQRFMMSTIDNIVRRGRVKGFNVMSITQRPAALHKNILSQSNSLVIMRMTSTQDRKAIFDWVNGNVSPEMARYVHDRLPSLGEGEGFLLEPQHGEFGLYRFPMIESYDSMRAPEDDEPEAILEGGVEVSAITAMLKEMTPAAPKAKKGKGEPGDELIPSATVGEIEALYAEIDALKANILPSRQQAYFQGVEDAMLVMEGAIKTRPLTEWGGPRAGIPVADIRPGVFSRPATEQVSVTIQNSPRPEPAPLPASPRKKSPGRKSSLAGKILETAIEIHPLKLNWRSLCTMAGCKSHGPQFNSARAHLLHGDVREEKDLISGDLLVIIANKHVPTDARSLSREEVLRRWMDKLPSMPAAMLTVLADIKNPITPELLAQKIGRANHGPQWNSAVNMLRTNGLLVQDAAGRWSLPDILAQGR
jgi:hypothetical protein